MFLPIFIRSQFANQFANWLRFCRISIDAMIAQQSCNCCAIISGICNSRATETNEKVSGIPLYIHLLAELHDSCTTIAQQLSTCRTKVAPQSLSGEITISCKQSYDCVWCDHCMQFLINRKQILGKISCDFWAVRLSPPMWPRHYFIVLYLRLPHFNCGSTMLYRLQGIPGGTEQSIK